MLLPISCIVEVYRGDLDVRVKSVLDEQDNTASVMGHEEMARQKLVLKVLDSLLQGDDCAISRRFASR